MMDTSETYIKMCDCSEIQTQRIRNPLPVDGVYYENMNIYEDWDGCYYAMRSRDMSGKVHYDVLLYADIPASRTAYETRMTNAVWLPRQDELQEMVEIGENLEAFEVGRANRIRYQLQGFASNNLDYSNRFTTMEQLWLAFVMKENYNKVWDGEDWVKEK